MPTQQNLPHRSLTALLLQLLVLVWVGTASACGSTSTRTDTTPSPELANRTETEKRCKPDILAPPLPEPWLWPERVMSGDDIDMMLKALLPMRSSPKGWTTILAESELEWFDLLPQVPEELLVYLEHPNSVIYDHEYIAAHHALVSPGALVIWKKLWAEPPAFIPDAVLTVLDCRDTSDGFVVKLEVDAVVKRNGRMVSRVVESVKLWLQIRRVGTKVVASLLCLEGTD